MADLDDRSFIPLPDGSLANTAAGAKRILAEMVGETLEVWPTPAVAGMQVDDAPGESPRPCLWSELSPVARMQKENELVESLRQWQETDAESFPPKLLPFLERGLRRMSAAVKLTEKFRIGEYEFCEPDHRQILVWAEAMGLEPLTVVERLFDDGTFFGLRGPCYRPDLTLTRFKNGRIDTLFWDRRLLPLRKFEWVEGLEITSITFSCEAQPRWEIHGLSLPLPNLHSLSCKCLGLSELDLSRVGSLMELHCSENNIEDLDLSRVQMLTWLSCSHNQLTELDLSGVPMLTELFCDNNQLTELDIRSLFSLETLSYDDDSVRLIQRPDQHFY